MSAERVIEAPPNGSHYQTPDQDTRRATISEVMEDLEQRYDKSGQPVGPARTLLNLDVIIKRDMWYRSRLRRNGLSESVEWEGTLLRDEDITRVRLCVARDYGLQYSMEDMHAVLAQTAWEMTYHPVVRYLQGVLWDEEPRIDRFLIDYLGVADSPLVRAISRRWFVSCVARAFGKGEKPVKVDTVLILAGKQGAKKSTAFRALASSPWFSDTALDLRSKDAYQAIRGVWIYELAELAATRPRDAETVKAFLSAPTDKFRPPYGRTVISSHRQCVFVGTTNEASFLRDATGARRFWPVSVGEIDVDAIRRDRDLLWAEAMEAYRAGEAWWLTAEEDERLRESQEQYQHEDPWEVAVSEWLTKIENVKAARKGVRIGEMLTHCLQMDKDRQGKHDEMRMGGVLQSLGWEKCRDRRDGRRVVVWRLPESE